MGERPDTTATSVPASKVPERIGAGGLEAKWGKTWEEDGVYAFDRTAVREQVHSIGTPPPTVSGSFHVGHVFSCTHTDAVARFQRMTGKAAFYPMGWDDNGLPTERRVQNYYGMCIDPSLPYVENFVPPHEDGEGKSIKTRDQQPIFRKNFVELCERPTIKDKAQFEALWRYLGLSVDWKQNYQAIGKRTRKIAQAAFLRNLKRGEAYQSEALGLWDITFQTAVTQAELESHEYPGFYHRLAFHLCDADAGAKAAAFGAPIENGQDVCIETTRPELLAACVALVAHPDDEHYKPLFGTKVASLMYGVEVPALAHPVTEMDRGAGIAMCCIFGDTTDISWWRDLELPLRAILHKDGCTQAETPKWIVSDGGREAFAEIAGETTFSAHEAVVARSRESGGLRGEPVKTVRQTNFFGKDDKPLEIMTSHQWYIHNGGRPWTNPASRLDLNEELVGRGHDLKFHPDLTRVRYKNWVTGLSNDWLVSRQRFFGVPLPLWYEADENGEVDYSKVTTPREDALPADPSTGAPASYPEEQRDKAGGLVGEPDIMDTWATPSLSPELACGWLCDEDLFERTYPMDLRPQGQGIIRTRPFFTVVCANLEFGVLPWQYASISGWIPDPDHKKVSESKGNVVTPTGLLGKCGSDAVRYWAASARLGLDATFDEAQMKIGRRLAIKTFNASKFALTTDGESTALDLDPVRILLELNRSAVAELCRVILVANDVLAAYDHSRALEVTESFFWTFRDDYLELVKERAYSCGGKWAEDEAVSARIVLAIVIDTVIRLLAPFLPYMTEEVWPWYRPGSIHRAPWPTLEGPEDVAGDPEALRVASVALIALRRVKSEVKVSPRMPFLKVSLEVPQASKATVEGVPADLSAASKVEGPFELIFYEAAEDGEAGTHVVSLELGEAPVKRKKA